jgi:uncharacterized coiled-coil protein SlyX
MNGRQILKVITGQQPGDEVAAIAGELDIGRRKGAEASSRLESLKLERKTANDFAAAKALDDQIAEAEWTIERAAALLPHLESKLKAARAERQAEGIVRHYKAAERAYRKLRVAIDAAAAVQVEAMAVRQEAIGELGEGIVQSRIPAVAFVGMLLPDLVELWRAELDRAFSGPPPKPKAVPPSPKELEKQLDHFRARYYEHPTPGLATIVESLKDQLQKASPAKAAASRAINPAMADSNPPKPKRVPRRDTAPGDGQRLVTILRNGVDVDGYQASNGDVLALPIAAAEALVKNGAADFTTTSPGVDS